MCTWQCVLCNAIIILLICFYLLLCLCMCSTLLFLPVKNVENQLGFGKVIAKIHHHLCRVWQLSNIAKGNMVVVISDSIPVFDEICRRFHNITFSCLNCGSDLVSFGLVGKYNKITSRKKCSFFVPIILVLQHLILGDTKCIGNGFQISLCRSYLPISWTKLALHMRLLLIREGQLKLCSHISYITLSREETDDIISYLVT